MVVSSLTPFVSFLVFLTRSQQEDRYPERREAEVRLVEQRPGVC